MTVQMPVIEITNCVDLDRYLLNIWQISWIKPLRRDEVRNRSGNYQYPGTVLCMADGKKVYSEETFERIVFSIGWEIAAKQIKFDEAETAELPPIKMEQHEQIR